MVFPVNHVFSDWEYDYLCLLDEDCEVRETTAFAAGEHSVECVDANHRRYQTKREDERRQRRSMFLNLGVKP